MLAGNVVHLAPEKAGFEAMLEGWARQQAARFLKTSTIEARLRLVRRMEEFTNAYPWQWTPADGEAFIAHLRGGDNGIKLTTARTYEVEIGLFVNYLLDGRYDWARVCQQRFGEVPQMVFHEGNSVVHVAEYEGDPRRRPLDYDEVQALFDAADARPGKIRGRGRKGALCALRDSAVLKTAYAFGLRRTESSMLDLVDLRRNHKVPMFGRFGSVRVRFGKASKGGPPKRRTVLTVGEMSWVVEALEHWLTEVRPQFGAGRHPALWVTERVGRLSPKSINTAFVAARDDAGLDPELDLHCLRYSFVTHLIEFGYPERFVQEQVGHRSASTTAIYSGVSNEYRNTMLASRLRARLGKDWGGQA
ncbi:tyrosine-type recombinase/integrase [Crossiella sp. SN42]|uniref:tyrosine-type recombinase/integrase n=1 Tax=Crossiella sp. SN42 TaxID=2944808 RepID=UPI00207CA550|nr:tyrosine-type recombinase/integrase [Crossiella sp. SN42]MCO1575547.1 tyrosine-type recombinase/integrase [Crossiella sp. SN42]